MLMGIDFFVVYVSDQKAAVDFYVNKLGLELRSCTPGELLFPGYHVCVAPPGSQTTLLLALRRDSSAVPPRPKIMLSCDNLEKTYEELSRAGVEFTQYPIGGFAVVEFVDLDGNTFLVTENRGNWIDEPSLRRLKEGIPVGPPPRTRRQVNRDTVTYVVTRNKHQ